MGSALADVLSGQVEPRGRLPVSIPRAEADCPVLHAIPDADGVLRYHEGLLIGYRGYDRAGRPPHFPFGHGLGYTTWEYESCVADGLDLVVRLRNTGGRYGREVVQAYVEPPDTDHRRPVRTLAAFAAVTAAPGERAEVRIALPRRAFARYSEEQGGWIWPHRESTVRIGRSSGDLPLAVTLRLPEP